jgi:hypothetical protein
MAELTGILKGTGAKVKADIQSDHVVFRGMLKAKAPLSEVSAEARGTLLLLHYKEHIVEVSAGSKAVQLAKKVNLG